MRLEKISQDNSHFLSFAPDFRRTIRTTNRRMICMIDTILLQSDYDKGRILSTEKRSVKRERNDKCYETPLENVCVLKLSSNSVLTVRFCMFHKFSRAFFTTVKTAIETIL